MWQEIGNFFKKQSAKPEQVATGLGISEETAIQGTETTQGENIFTAETPVMSEARKKLLTYAMLGSIFSEMNSQTAEPAEHAKPKIEPKT